MGKLMVSDGFDPKTCLLVPVDQTGKDGNMLMKVASACFGQTYTLS